MVRVKNVLESRNPLISLANDFNPAAITDEATQIETRDSSGTVNVPLATMNALVEQLEHIETHGAGNHQFYTKVGNKLRRIELDEIRYIQVEGKYSAIQLETRQYHVKASLKDLLVILASDAFVRVSRNFVVNLKHIDHIDVYQSTVHVARRRCAGQPDLQGKLDEKRSTSLSRNCAIPEACAVPLHHVQHVHGKQGTSTFIELYRAKD